jgi:exosortase
VVPVLALLVLWRRGRFPAGARPSGWGVALLLAGAAVRLTGVYFYLDWLDAASLLPTLAGLCLLGGGWPALRWAWPAVVFLCFMLPLPYQAEMLLAHPLRRLATRASTFALQTLGLPALAQGNVVVIDDLKIGVVEACSGLGMLMTFFALSTAVALAIRRPFFDRAVVFLSAVPIGLLMNVLRITVTAVLFRTAGPAVAGAVFHDLAGWVMMPLALAVLWLELRLLARLFVEPERTGPVPLRLGVPDAPHTPTRARSAPPAGRPLQEVPDVSP